MNQFSSSSYNVMTAQEVSHYLRIPLSSVWKLTKKGKVRGAKVGKHWRYLQGDVIDFLQGATGCVNEPRAVPTEKRQSVRHPCEFVGRLRTSFSARDSDETTCIIRDLSREGAQIVSHKSFEVGTEIEIFFELPEISPQTQKLGGRVAYHLENSKHKMGMEFGPLDARQRKVLDLYVA